MSDDPQLIDFALAMRAGRHGLQTIADQHVVALCMALTEVMRLAEGVALGGELYPVGVREEARKIAAGAKASNDTIGAVLQRSYHAR